MRLLTVLLALAAYLLAIASAAGATRDHAPAAVRRQLRNGFSGDDLALDHFMAGQMDHESVPSSDDGGDDTPVSNGLSRKSRCSPDTPVGTMWVNYPDSVYTCAPVVSNSGKNYCVAATMEDYHSGLNLCNKRSDCGPGHWCIMVTGESKVCWRLASGCDNYSTSGGTDLKK